MIRREIEEKFKTLVMSRLGVEKTLELKRLIGGLETARNIEDDRAQRLASTSPSAKLAS